MSVKIGHASIGENGEISGGNAGDQTGKEVCTRSFYMHKKGWDTLRAKKEEIAELIAICMEEACANPCVGYDQGNRLSLYNTVKNLSFKCDTKTLTVKVECDCSSLVRTCLARTGIMVGNFTTANEKTVLMATGLFEFVECDSDGSNLKRGDILVTKTKGHTAVVLSDGESTVERIRKDGYGMKTLKKGTKHEDVRTFENLMKKLGYYTGELDTSFGSGCVKATNAFQKDYPECGTNGKPDGSFGPRCWKRLFELNK